MIGAFIIHGITPGPFMMQTNGELVYALFASMLIANVVHLVVGRFGIPIRVQVTTAPGVPEQGQRRLVAPELNADLGEDPVGLSLDVAERLFGEQLVGGDPAARLRHRRRRVAGRTAAPAPAPYMARTLPVGIVRQGSLRARR